MQKSNDRFLLRPIISTSLGIICIIVTLYLLIFSDYNKSLGRYAPAVFLSIGLIWPVSNVLKEPLGNSDKRSMYILAIIGFAIAIIYGIITKGTEHKDFLDNYFDSLTTDATYYFYLISLIVTTILSFLYPQRIGMVSTAILFGLLFPFLLVGCLFIIIYIIIIILFSNKMYEITDGFRAERELWKSIKNLGKKKESSQATSNKVYNSEYDSNGIDSF